MRERCALLSVYDKSGIEEFARALADDGWRIYASGGTARTLAAAGIATTDVADLVGGGAILGHRVVTLSREIHAGLLARPVDEDLAELDTSACPSSTSSASTSTPWQTRSQSPTPRPSR